MRYVQHFIGSQRDLIRSQALRWLNILIPMGPQSRCHDILQEACTAPGQIETMVDALQGALEHQHQRLDTAHDAELHHLIQEQ